MQFLSYHPPPPNDLSLISSVTPTWNYTQHNYPPKPVPHVPNDPDLDPSLSYTSSSDTSDSSYSRYSKWRQFVYKKLHIKSCNNDAIKVLTAKLPKSAYNSKVTIFKLDEYSLQRRVYLLNFMNSLKIVSS